MGASASLRRFRRRADAVIAGRDDLAPPSLPAPRPVAAGPARERRRAGPAGACGGEPPGIVDRRGRGLGGAGACAPGPVLRRLVGAPAIGMGWGWGRVCLYL